MKYKKIRETLMDEIQLNAGILLESFEPDSATVEKEKIIGATSGGFKFSDAPTYSDFGEDIDNCPKNTKELKMLDRREVSASGNFVSITANLAKSLVGASELSGDKITPRDDLYDTDFTDLWWVGDYSNKNGETNGGFIAIHMMNTLNTGGFQLQSGDKAKGQFAFNYTAHYSIANQDTVPYEVYIKAGTEEE